MRELERALLAAGPIRLFGESSFAEPERFALLQSVATEDDFVAFINVCNRCLVESIERFGSSIGRPSYFWNEIKTTVPDLFRSLHRIKVYRHNAMHLKLNHQTDSDVREFLHADLEGRRLGDVQDVWFALQQCVLDELVIAVQTELARLT